MNLFLLAVIVIAAASAGVALMYVIHRRSREDYLFIEIEQHDVTPPCNSVGEPMPVKE